MPSLRGQLALSLLVVAAGCPAVVDAATPRVTAVVADISPGTNPYHEVFRRPTWTEHPCTVIPGFPCDAPALNLTLGDDYLADLAADALVWKQYRRGVIYWVPGTNLLLTTMRSWDGFGLDVHDGFGGKDVGHGLGTSSAAAVACPGCYVLVIQDSNSIDGVPIQEVADHLPWVDFVVSTNVPGQLGSQQAFLEHYAAATRALADSGRFFFAASGDFVTFATDERVGPPSIEYDAPPWVVMVGGAYEDLAPFGFTACHATDAQAGKPADFAGEFLQLAPAVETVAGYTQFGGTSASAPQIAGRFAHALRGIRQVKGDHRGPGLLWTGVPSPSPALKDGKLTAEELRTAFAGAGRYWHGREIDPACAAWLVFGSTSYTPAVIPMGLPWAQMGWGYVGRDEAQNAIAIVLGTRQPDVKPLQAILFMNSFMELRKGAFP